jgi:hypothetical protein
MINYEGGKDEIFVYNKRNWSVYPFKIITSTLMNEYLIVYLDTTEFALVLNEIYTSTYISQLAEKVPSFGDYLSELYSITIFHKRWLSQIKLEIVQHEYG